MKSTPATNYISARLAEWVGAVHGSHVISWSRLSRVTGIPLQNLYRLARGKGMNSTTFLAAVAAIRPSDAQWLELGGILKEAERLRVELSPGQSRPTLQQLESAIGN